MEQVKDPSHVAENVVTETPPGEDTSHVDGVTTQPEPGVGEHTEQPPEGGKAPEKVLSEGEWKQREADLLSKKDTEIGELRQHISQSAMQETMRQAQTQAAQLGVQDERAVEAGDMTSAQAVERQHARQEIAQQKQALTIEAQRLQSTHQQNEPLYRELAAIKIAKKHSVDVDALLGDDLLDSPDKMIAKAQTLIGDSTNAEIDTLKKEIAVLKGDAPPPNQKFDQGQAGGAGTILGDEKAQNYLETTRSAYGEAETERRHKQRR